MKKRGYIISLAIAVAIAVGGAIWLSDSGPAAVLTFKTYERSKTNASQFAVLELKNNSRASIWIEVSGSHWPLSPDFLECPKLPMTNGVVIGGWFFPTNASLSFFMAAHEIKPGDSTVLNCPLDVRMSRGKVGIEYYAGNSTNANDVLTVLDGIIGYPARKMTLKERLDYYWREAKLKFGRLKIHQVWCPQLLSYQGDNGTNSSK